MSLSRKNPSDVDVALSELAGPKPPDVPAGSEPVSNAQPSSPDVTGSPGTGNGSAPDGNTPLMASAGEDPPPVDPQVPRQPPPAPAAPQGPPQPPAAPGPPNIPPPTAGQAPPGAPGYFQGQAMPPQPPPGYPGYAGYPQQPGGPYERRGLVRYWYEYPALRWLTVIVALAVIALLVWLLAFKSNGSSSATLQPGGGPVGATEQDLIALSQRLNQPIYWAGNVTGTRMELTETSNSYAYLRYLTSDAPVGDSSPNFLTVGTYPSTDAFRNLRSYAAHSRAKTERIQNGGIAVVVPKSPTSVYFAYPGQDVQVEVYDPQANRALAMVKSGQVHPVPGGVTTTTTTGAAAPAVPAVPSQTTPGSVTTPQTTAPSTTAAPTTPPIPGG